MKNVEKLYWLRFVLGIVAAFICAGYGIVTGSISNINFEFVVLMNGLSLAIIVYIMSYYIIKRKFMFKLEKQKKIFMTGIGIYFLAWLIFWIFLYTIIAGAPPV